MLFQKNIVKKYIATLNYDVEAAWNQYKSYFLVPKIQANIRQSKEEQFQEGFLRELFVKVLGYTLNPSPDFNLITEQKNETNSQKADGAILLDGNVIGVIELKDHKTTDLSKIEKQAFGYKSQHRDARYVIISNFEKLRLYIDNAVDFREWSLFSMTFDEFREMYLCIAWDQMKNGIALKIKSESVSSEDQITNALYKDYSQFKQVLFANILKNNPAPEDKNESDWQLLLFKKTQKLLDRLLFIFFAEDCGLLPPNSMVEIIKQWRQLKELDEYKPLYDRIKKYFGYLDTGHQGKHYEIFAYNGGLFKPDEVLDNLKISDEVLEEPTIKLASYDFESDVDVNILGHIFENSLSEIEEITQQITNGEIPKTSKRKQDGVFYTPQYITKYIVENTVGKLCAEKKAELGIVEEDYFSDQKRQKQTKIKLIEQLSQYREWLLQITICDPACGSGAFLNAALQFLIAEHKLIDEMEAKVAGESLVFPNVENSILENNLFGVDINEESVEIAQLALWLRTAKPHRKLNTLSQNIKCGNSLISDPAVAGDKAFDWQKEFPKVFEKGGFDVVIGNPPYGADVPKDQLSYIIEHYSDWGISKTLSDTYFVFYAKSLAEIVKPQGLLGFITPNTWKLIDSAQRFRDRLMKTNYKVYRIAQYLDKVFEEATVDCDTLFIQTEANGKDICIDFVRGHEIINSHIVTQKRLSEQRFYNLFLTEKDYKLIEKVLSGSFLVNDELIIKNGVKPYEKGKGTPPQTAETLRIKPYTSEVKVDDSFSPLIGGSYFNRYRLIWNNNYWIKYGEWLAAPRDSHIFEIEEKLIFRQTSDSLIGYIIGKGYIMRDNTHIILNKENSPYNLRYVLACLNSKLLNFYYWTINPEKGEAMAQVKAFHLGLLPIKNIPISDQQPFIDLADKMLSLNSELQQKRSRFLRRLQDNFEGVKITGALESFDVMEFAEFLKELKKQKITLSLSRQDEWEEYFNQYKTDCNNLSAEIAATDNAIDLKVYKLYGLTYDEVLVVDKDTKITREEYEKE